MRGDQRIEKMGLCIDANEHSGLPANARRCGYTPPFFTLARGCAAS
jgi:hypothetical protein